MGKSGWAGRSYSVSQENSQRHVQKQRDNFCTTNANSNNSKVRMFNHSESHFKTQLYTHHIISAIPFMFTFLQATFVKTIHCHLLEKTVRREHTFKTVARRSSGNVSLKAPRFALQSGVRYALQKHSMQLSNQLIFISYVIKMRN